jgi:hypothetical protein
VTILRPWPSDNEVKFLADKSGGQFVYATTVLKFVDDEDSRPVDQLEKVMNLSRSGIDVGSAAGDTFLELDLLYRQILSTCRNQSLLLRILGCILVAEEPVSVLDVENLLSLQEGDVGMTLRRIHSLLFIPKRPTECINVYHKSLSDFMFNRDRAQNHYINYDLCYEVLTYSCMDVIRRDGVKAIRQYAGKWWDTHCVKARITDALVGSFMFLLSPPSALFLDEDHQKLTFVISAMKVWKHWKVSEPALIRMFLTKPFSSPTGISKKKHSLWTLTSRLTG